MLGSASTRGFPVAGRLARDKLLDVLPGTNCAASARGGRRRRTPASGFGPHRRSQPDASNLSRNACRPAGQPGCRTRRASRPSRKDRLATRGAVRAPSRGAGAADSCRPGTPNDPETVEQSSGLADTVDDETRAARITVAHWKGSRCHEPPPCGLPSPLRWPLPVSAYPLPVLVRRIPRPASRSAGRRTTAPAV
jgi:hypothetical protein